MRADVVALVFTMCFPSLMSWIEFWVLPGVAVGDGPALHKVFALGKLIQFVFPVAYVWFVARWELRPARPHLRGMGLGIAFGLLVAAGTFALYFLVLKRTDLFGDTPQKLAAWLA